jgi:CRISPR-associated endonuclease/helicase Cas3
MRYDDFFQEFTGGCTPWDWQQRLAKAHLCGNQTLRVPTGFGKTLGVVGSWLWHRVKRNDDGWPRRLVWCLPMRVLVEQTGEEVRAALGRLDLLWDDTGDHSDKVGVHTLMGGSEPGSWHQYPEQFAVIIGTQDMLLSRALNRGYAVPRARWPMDFGLLSQDALWVMDEVQLMDVGLATSAQLQAFRDDDTAAGKAIRPCRTWWMSATLQPDWLAKSPDTQVLVRDIEATAIPAEARTGRLWDSVFKPFEQETVANVRALAGMIRDRHLESGRGEAGPTLVVMNTVDRAVEVWEALTKDAALAGTDRRLIHSRFRPYERSAWQADFLNRAACGPHTDRIIVATQVIEAGVDISSDLLVTESAPWPNLVQRFGRCARWGGRGHVLIVKIESVKTTLPYDQPAVTAAEDALRILASGSLEGPPQVSPLSLERFEEAYPELLPELYPYAPAHLLLRHELDELFDTTPDLSGADIDISRFIRSGDERDLHVFWAAVDPKARAPATDVKPARDALCAVPFLKARDWLFKTKSDAFLPGKRAWVWDFQDGAWRTAKRNDLYPGQTLLVAADSGGYEPTRGFWPGSGPVMPVAADPVPLDAQADATQDDESLSAYDWKTIATHGRETGELARSIARILAPEHAELLGLGGRWHDGGKVHLAFRGSIRGDPPEADRDDLAKAPKAAWPTRSNLYRMPDGSRRPGFRHELASTLALFGVLQRRNPTHTALLGPWINLIEQAGLGSSRNALQRQPPPPSTPLEDEILALEAHDFDLLAYLVCAHHGKLRMAWHAAKSDQCANDSVLRIRGIRHGERLPAVPLCATDGTPHELPETIIDLAPSAAGISPTTGAAWTDRVLGLLDRHGPFSLAWLEAILRAADQRASQLSTRDPLLEKPHGRDRLETDRRRLAQADTGGETSDPAEPNPAESRTQHGLRGRAGGREDAGGRTTAPHGATRYVSTTLGVLSYTQLAPYLARNVERMEESIAEGDLAERSLDENLLRDLHAGICMDLTPEMAGRWRRIDVRVSDHQAPSFPQVPILMRDYCQDLQARLSALTDLSDEHIPELLAFAEGRLLSIHPFEDFNGRTTRLLIAELLRRLELPALDPTPDPGDETRAYLAALKEADRASWQPLIQVWLGRFAKEGQA